MLATFSRYCFQAVSLLAIAFSAIACFPSTVACGDEPTPAASDDADENGGDDADEDEKFPAWAKVTKGATRLDGLFPLYYNEKEQKLFMEISSDQYGKELICPMSIARGAGLAYLGGDTLNFGDQWVLAFSRAGDRILITRKNVRFRADDDSPEADAVKISYNDSVIAAIDIQSEQDDGQKVLIDLADLLMTDLAGLGIDPISDRCTWAKVKAFPNNVEIEVNLVFPMSGAGSFFMAQSGAAAAPDPRGAQIVLHYGFSLLPDDDGYSPRAADDRIGAFQTTLKDFSTDIRQSAAARYVTRWQLEKDDPEAKMSPPKEPIIFWIEKTVPRKYRSYVRDGILEWNKAFEKIGFINAIQVRDQQSDDEFDPEDIRYNTFRWIATSAGFAMGPSRTNPKTGRILDADIVFDEGMIRYWRQEYLLNVGLPQSIALLRRGERQAFLKYHAADLPAFLVSGAVDDKLLTGDSELLRRPPAFPRQPSWKLAAADRTPGCECCMMGPGIQRQLSLAAVYLTLADEGESSDKDGDDDSEDGEEIKEPGKKVPEELINQAVKHVVMHEVGHTLGLRHNFKASNMLGLAEINNPDVTKTKGAVGSVMDYSPANYARRGEKQGEYFSTTLGPYDYWAIEYMYKPIDGDEAEGLAKIASKAATPELAYATDEDLYGNPDPRVNLFDLGDPLDYAKQRIELVQSALDKLEERVVGKGEGWQRSRDAFSMLMGELSTSCALASQYVGAEYTYRHHKGDPDAKPPFEVIPIEKQRAALALLQEQILSAKAFQFSPALLRSLAPEYWEDAENSSASYRYPVYEVVLGVQQIALARFLDPDVLTSMQDVALHAEPGQQTLPFHEVFEALTTSIWSELPVEIKAGEKTKIDIGPFRRNLQREHYKRLAELLIGRSGQTVTVADLMFTIGGSAAPADARSLARLHLKQIAGRLGKVLESADIELDQLTRAHLEESHDRIAKVLAASLEAAQP